MVLSRSVFGPCYFTYSIAGPHATILAMQKKSRWTLLIIAIQPFLWVSRAYDLRNNVSNDGISYLDLGDAFFAGHWDLAINAYWSPGLPLLLGLVNRLFQPTVAHEFLLHRIALLLICAFAYCALLYLVYGLLAYRLWTRTNATNESNLQFFFSDEMVKILAALAFSDFVLNTNLSTTTHPNLFAIGFVFLACGLLLRIKLQRHSIRNAVLMGCTLAAGYWTRAHIFPLSFIFFFCTLVELRPLRFRIGLTLAAAGSFLLACSPWLAMLYSKEGRVTLGTSGAWNYLVLVDNERSGNSEKSSAIQFIYDCSEQPIDHPVRRIVRGEVVAYEFATPIRGTYPAWTDPPYWTQGMPVGFSLRKVMRCLARNLRALGKVFFNLPRTYLACLLATLAALALITNRIGTILRQLGRFWFFWLIGFVELMAYVVVFVKARYVAGALLLLLLTLLCAIVVPRHRIAKSWSWAAFLCAVACYAVVLAPHLAGLARLSKHVLINHEIPLGFHQRLAIALQDAGVSSDARIVAVGVMPWSGPRGGVGWARLLRARVVARISQSDAPAFWNLSPEDRQSMLLALRRRGATHVVGIPSEKIRNQEPWRDLQWASHGVLDLKRLGPPNESDRRNAPTRMEKREAP